MRRLSTIRLEVSLCELVLFTSFAVSLEEIIARYVRVHEVGVLLRCSMHGMTCWVLSSLDRNALVSRHRH